MLGYIPFNYDCLVSAATVHVNLHRWSEDIYRQFVREMDVWVTVGCHPRHASAFTSFREAQMREMLGWDKVVAIGEIGLDVGHESSSSREEQERVFRRCLEIGVEMDKPLCLHVKGRKEEAGRIMRDVGVPRKHRIHMHCWADSWQKCQVSYTDSHR